jgi:replicative DNA helicase
MFLYSEEMHNPNTDRKGQVDVIIAKHRHGPIGEVALHFEKRYTQFSNLEVKR